MSALLQDNNQAVNPEVKKEEVKVNSEVKTEDKKPNVEDTKPNPLAEQFQRIAKQEKFVAAERQKIEEAKKVLETEKQFAESYKSLKGKNPFEILEHFGITYEQLLEADKARNNPIDPVAKKALEKIQELEQKMTEKEKEAEKARIAKVEMQLKADIENEIKVGEYDIIEVLDAKDAVKEYMEEMYETTGEIPTIKEACEAVTNYLVDKVSKAQQSKWLKPKEEPKVEVKSETPKPEVISNKMTQTSTIANRPMTEAERLAAAVAVMNGTFLK